jgi:non-ribosomal peptide synthase protein (TIGR01720 family)
VEEVKARQAQTPQRGVGFGVLRHLLGRAELAAAARLPAVRFNYLGEVDRLLGNELFRYSPGETGPDIAPDNHMTCELEVVAMIVAGRLRLRLTHHAQAQTPESIRSLAEAVCVNLRRLLDAPAPLASRRARPEDFDAAGLSSADLNELFKP